MTTTPNLGLPYIDPAQAQKHVTHNQAIRGLDALVQTAIVTRTLSAAPAAPANGACYILSAAGSGAWAGQGVGTVAAWQDGAWQFYVPKTGWLAWVVDEATTVNWTGTSWQSFGPASNLPQFGVNATPDVTNKLSVNSSAILFNNIGNSVQLKLNKHGVADTASVLYQDNFSGRAETGLTGDDGYHFKVSPDGSTWLEALRIDSASALVTVYSDPAAALGIATKQYVDARAVPTLPGGSSGQLQVNNGGAFGGFTANGDVTINGATGAVTVAANAVTNAKAAQMAANSLKGNNTGVAANAADLTVAQAKALLAIGAADVSGLGALATASAINLASQATGTLQPAQEPAHTGDVTNSAGSLALTISANAVTNAKAAQMAANSLKGNNTASTANAADLTAAQVKALLAIGAVDVSGLGALAIASSVNLASQATGTLQAAQEPAHTGDVTNAAGSLALAISANAVTNAKSAQMAANTLKGNNTAAAANAADLTAAQVKALLAIGTADVAGLGALATASTVNLATQATGTTQAAQEPAHTGDVTNAAGSLALAISANAVTNAKAAQMPASSIKGNNTGAAANAADLSVAQTKALLAIGVADVSGLPPASGSLLVNEFFLSLAADQTGTNVATAQTMFPGGGATQIALAAATTYDFECRLEIDTTGATAHQLGILFGGSATLTSIDYTAWTTNAATATTPSAASATRSTVATVTNVTASAAAATQNSVWIRGTVRVNAAGTLIPQFQYSAAPGAAPVVRRNSQFRLWAKGANTVLSSGAWS